MILKLESFSNRLKGTNSRIFNPKPGSSVSKQKFNPSLSSEVVLSEREKEVLTLVCMEFTATEIAQKMDISARTVEAIKDRLMERFGVKNSVGLVFYAMKNQLIE